MARVRVVTVVGPTAAGKSELAVALAGRLGGEIVNADSMQLYRGMDLGTAKLGPGERGGVPHHLLDIWHVTETANVADYQRRARDMVGGLLARGVPPVLVGGSGLYVRAVIDDLRFPGTDPRIRERLESELAETGPAALHKRLRGSDPDAATTIDPGNGRRIVRALEVIELTGEPFTAELPAHESDYDVTQIGITAPREVLDRRIELRVDRMWRAGLVDEVRALRDEGLESGVTASRALGYAQVLRYLAGDWSEQFAKEETVRRTRRFARRQESWFRRDPRVRWLAFDRTDLVEAALAVVRAT